MPSLAFWTEGMPEFLYSCYLLYKNQIVQFVTFSQDDYDDIFIEVGHFGLPLGGLVKTI